MAAQTARPRLKSRVHQRVEDLFFSDGLINCSQSFGLTVALFCQSHCTYGSGSGRRPERPAFRQLAGHGRVGLVAERVFAEASGALLQALGGPCGGVRG
jgi:hypothetical protein